ncbi:MULTISPECIES: hypothetical protein [Metabacillus]|uniref:Uncharacterized protein n=3 Tax=Metabacillus TaxID=2675233 RepID=A0A179T274_9BACI|nr:MULTISPECIES: hypothetical protein [Metabacillus]OAS87744.1 hypothetical protein A6K24_18555 [Metabacillus litoralis]QNF27242.1 hypothetical protein HUW50_06770 [Metabacillus sp. KUDC1714]
MGEGIKFLVEVVNNIHDILILILNDVLGLQMTDKDMHFWIMGFIGIFTFACVYVISKWLSEFPFGIHLIAFLYTLTFMFVLVFAIEIQQAITNRGNMEFVDAIIGLWGFIALFLVYVVIAVFLIITKLIFKKIRRKDDDVDL